VGLRSPLRPVFGTIFGLAPILRFFLGLRLFFKRSVRLGLDVRPFV
jgi:hypothetical protein